MNKDSFLDDLNDFCDDISNNLSEEDRQAVIFFANDGADVYQFVFGEKARCMLSIAYAMIHSEDTAKIVKEAVKYYERNK